jgi:hypothetical protein
MVWRLGGMAAALALAAAGLACRAAAPAAGAPPAQAWAELAKLPDWGGVWIPDQRDQDRQVTANPPPWTPAAARQIQRMAQDEQDGDPRGLFINCLPEAMPSWMLVSHNAMEILFTPGRVTMLGESDGNRLRRIYTDGRPHPEDPDLTFHGHSIGHWEGDTLVVDTVGVLPESLIAVGEAVGLPNNGDMRIAERIRLAGPDTLNDELVITAPHVLAAPWKTTRVFHRRRGPAEDIIEGVCLQGGFSQRKDADGNAVFVPLPHDKGIPVAPSVAPVTREKNR